MKRCTLCGQIYSDELVYCLQDGTALVADQTDAEIPTVVRPHRPEQARSSFLKYAAVAIFGLLAVFVAGAIGALVVWNWVASPGGETAENTQLKPSPTPSATAPSRTPTSTPAPSPTAANVRSEPTPTRSPTPVDDEEEDDDGFQDPGTARINFRRGRVSENVSGRIARSRSFVLRTLGGQFLTASIGSPRGCVVFANSGASTAFSTQQGDSRLDIRNNCERPVRFSLNVTVR